MKHTIVALNMVATNVKHNLLCYERVSQLSMISNISKQYTTSASAVRNPMKQEYVKN